MTDIASLKVVGPAPSSGFLIEAAQSSSTTTTFTVSLDAVRAFHDAVVQQQPNAQLPAFPFATSTADDVDDDDDKQAASSPFTGIEALPSLSFFGAWYVLHFKLKLLDVLPAAGAALAVGSAVLFVVLAVLRLSSSPSSSSRRKTTTTTTSTATAEQVSAHLDLVLAQLDSGAQHALVKQVLLLETNSRADWPSRFGDIDLAKHDLPHESCSTEWWYYNSHFTATSASTDEPPRDFSFFASFFRIVKHVDPVTGRKLFGHAVTWALVDVHNKDYYFDVVLDQTAPQDLLSAMERNERTGASDPMLRRALMDVLRKGNVPLPDRLMQTAPQVGGKSGELSLNYDGNTLRKTADTGAYVVHCHNGKVCVDVTFAPEKKPVRHGDYGVVKGHENADEDMFYYFIPRCKVEGRFTLGGSTYTIGGGRAQGWYDHEFGGVPKPSTQSKMDYAWNWIAIQLDDPKMEISAATLSDPRTGNMLEVKAVVVDEHGRRTQYDGLRQEMSFAPVQGRAEWTSVRTFRKYPVVFQMRIPALGLDVELDASEHPDQEFMTLLSKPAFWEGRMKVAGQLGTDKKQKVSGLAFFERNGFDPDQSISTFFKNVGIAVRDSVEAMYPLRPTQKQAIELIASDNTKHYCDDVPLDILGDTLIAPVRLIADRGGKSWRSYAALACVDAVGGDSRKFVQWVAMPEFLHVGSLIVDDIQDKSETRRGGPCAHLVHGEPLAINAGTAAYFQCEQLLSVPGLTAEDQIKCYKLYFAALRGGHAGQALDIYGNDYMMDDVVASGDSSLLEKRICAIHRLKTAVPAGTLARMGCTVGGGTQAQIESVGLFMEAVGVAFQIMDDVLNLRGVYAGKADKTPGAMLKTLGEDIVDGKVTMPVSKYMGVQRDASERRRIWSVIQSKPSDPAVVQQVIDELERVGAVEACVKMATDIVEHAWEKVDKEIPDSFAKLMLRSFGWYVTK